MDNLINNEFEGNEFVVQLLAKGAFVDSSAGDDGSYLIEAFTLRLNHVALNAWILSETMNCRECYNTDEEWKEHKAEYKARREAWNKMIINSLGLEPNEGSVSITQAQSEVFTVVHIRKVA